MASLDKPVTGKSGVRYDEQQSQCAKDTQELAPEAKLVSVIVNLLLSLKGNTGKRGLRKGIKRYPLILITEAKRGIRLLRREASVPTH
jgi:hypothetical protein